MSSDVATLEVETSNTEQTVEAGDCPECDGQIVQDGAEQVCDECGLVVDEYRIDHGPEWRAFDANGRKRAQGLQELHHDRGMGSEIGWKQIDDMPGQKRVRMLRMRKEHSRARMGSKVERNLKAGFIEIQRVGTALGIDESRREQAGQLYRTAQDERIVFGRCIESAASACLYAVARIHGDPLRLDRVVEVARVGRNRVARAYQHLNQQLEIPAQPRRPSTYLPAAASELGLSDTQRLKAEEIAAEFWDDGNVGGKDPAGVAGAAIWVSVLWAQQQPVADAVGVSIPTIRNRANEMRDLGVVE